jgi:FdhD protein
MVRSEDPLAGLGYAPTTGSRQFERIDGHELSSGVATIAEEVPIALVYNGRSHAVVMGTPSDLEDLAFGFSLTEGVVGDASDIRRVAVVKASHGIEIQIEVPAAAGDALVDRARGLVARTGCGLCGVESINEALRVPVRVGSGLSVKREALWRAAGELSRGQTLNNETSAIHGAAWSTGEEPALVREDVGRHNALDKLIGALARAGRDANAGFVVVTSRASYEMVQKVATRGIELIAAVSRPTGLAIRFADASGVTLVGLLRGHSANVYTQPHRLIAG